MKKLSNQSLRRMVNEDVYRTLYNEGVFDKAKQYAKKGAKLAKKGWDKMGDELAKADEAPNPSGNEDVQKEYEKYWANKEKKNESLDRKIKKALRESLEEVFPNDVQSSYGKMRDARQYQQDKREFDSKPWLKRNLPTWLGGAKKPVNPDAGAENADDPNIWKQHAQNYTTALNKHIHSMPTIGDDKQVFRNDAFWDNQTGEPVFWRQHCDPSGSEGRMLSTRFNSNGDYNEEGAPTYYDEVFGDDTMYPKGIYGNSNDEQMKQQAYDRSVGFHNDAADMIRGYNKKKSNESLDRIVSNVINEAIIGGFHEPRGAGEYLRKMALAQTLNGEEEKYKAKPWIVRKFTRRPQDREGVANGTSSMMAVKRNRNKYIDILKRYIDSMPELKNENEKYVFTVDFDSTTHTGLPVLWREHCTPDEQSGRVLRIIFRPYKNYKVLGVEQPWSEKYMSDSIEPKDILGGGMDDPTLKQQALERTKDIIDGLQKFVDTNMHTIGKKIGYDDVNSAPQWAY